MTCNETLSVLKSLASSYPHAKVFQGNSVAELVAKLKPLLDEWDTTLGAQHLSDVMQAVNLYRSTSPPLMPYAREIVSIMKENNSFRSPIEAAMLSKAIAESQAEIQRYLEFCKQSEYHAE